MSSLVRCPRVARHLALVALLVGLASSTARAQIDQADGLAPGVRALPSPGDQGGAPPVEHLLHFVVENEVALAEPGATLGVGGSVLGRLTDTEIAVVAPGLEFSARKELSQAEWNALIGDDDWDGDFWEQVGGEIDALGRRPSAPSEGALQTEDWIFSTEHAWGLAAPFSLNDAYGALDGTLFRLARGPDGSLKTDRFLTEKMVLKSLGQGDDASSADVDIDAFAVDAEGNVFLSFRSTEWVNGRLVADDGVVCVPAYCMHYNASGNIDLIEADCAAVVFDKPQTDQWVQHAELSDAHGNPIKILEDLTGLAIDPQGGVFEPLDPIPGMPNGAPHLFFTGTRLGPMVLSTRDGGGLAQLNGQPLGAPVLSGKALGLDAASSSTNAADLAALHVETVRPSVPLIDLEEGQLHFLYNPQATLLLEGFTPDSWVWLMFDGHLPYYGESWQAQAYSGPGSSQRLVPGLGLQLPLKVDARGRARLVMPPAGSAHHSFYVMVQALELGSARLSRPAAIWCDHGGALAGDPLPD